MGQGAGVYNGNQLSLLFRPANSQATFLSGLEVYLPQTLKEGVEKYSYVKLFKCQDLLDEDFCSKPSSKPSSRFGM